MTTFLLNNWQLIVMAVLSVFWVITRATPTKKDDAIADKAVGLWSAFPLLKKKK